ncbi:MAG TPA: chemotaxis protein CheB [Polyangia bacterium]|nr:chemotaxis protein CheB [Polyangia bacterium]
MSGCPVVGIGASAGGIEALQAFFRHLPAEPGAAFVIVQHLDPHAPSLLVELLGRVTPVPIRQATDGQPLEQNQIYVIPPNALLTIAHGALRTSMPMPTSRAPIDVLFRSLAEECGASAVGIVLSGTGSDGTLGLRSIKEHGGMIMAQTIASARYDNMPRSAIALGFVDHVLPVEELPVRLADYLAHLKKCPRYEGLPEQGLDATEDELRTIYTLLQQETGHDFSRYKRATVVRRIQRRMNVLRETSLAGYIALLGARAGELQELFNDLLIGVTSFFRDPEVYTALATTVLPKVLAGRGKNDQVRVWVPGCASGEEAYSIAILLRELTPPGGPVLKVFATDIDVQALEVARRGAYPDRIAEQVSRERLERFFVQEIGGYRIGKELRELCLFSLHSLIADPPFSHLDLISCRNVLIYLDAELQKNLFPLFHFALRPGGYLLLGPSESVQTPELFKTIDKPHRIFQRQETVGPVALPLVGPTAVTRRGVELPRRAPLPTQQDVTRAFERVLLERFAPAAVVVRATGDIVYVSGRTGRYLELASGITNTNIIDMARRDLRPDLHRALREAAKTGAEVVQQGLCLEDHGEVRRLNLIVRPLTEIGSPGDLLLIVFQELGPAVPTDHAAAAGLLPRTDDSLAQALEEQLRSTKEHLQETIAELEVSNEEFKSTNEELLATNEELQSANEELQTSREELQSVNEELHTVNTELNLKLEELDKANSDLQNFFTSTEIAAVFLDHRLRIKKFSPAASRVFPLIDSDLGRPITDITATVASEDLVAEIREVLRTLVPRERQVRRSDTDVWYLRSIRPYRATDHVIGGVVLTFVDVTELKQAQERAHRLAAIVESSEDAIIGLTPELRVLSWSRGAEHLLGPTAHEMLGQSISLVQIEGGPQALGPLCERIRQGERIEPFKAAYLRRDGRRLRLVVSLSPVIDPGGTLTGVSVIAHDVTRQERSEQALLASEERLRQLVESDLVSIAFFDLSGRMVEANDAFLKTTGYGREEILRISWNDLTPPESRGLGMQIFEEIKAGGRCLPHEILCRRRDGATFPALLGGALLRERSEGIALLLDISERRRVETLEMADRRKDEFLAMLAHELRNPLAPIRNAVEVLLGPALDETRRARALQMIDRQVRHMARLIDDLLDLSRVSHGKIRLHVERVELGELVRTTIGDHQPAAQAAGVLLDLVVPEAPIWLLADPVRVAQSLANLLGNAFKFSPRGTRVLVEVKVERGAREALLRVTDEGMGMAPELLARMFQPFEQGEHSPERGGLGLGLALVQRLMELHGGRVEAASEGPGKGSVFVLHLPLAEMEAGDPTGDPEVAAPRVRRVLVIEDNVDAAESLSLVLELAGHEVFIAGTGAAGVEKARELQPDVVLCDIGLPGGMDGYAVAGALRADPATASIYLAALTGYGMAEDRSQALAAGFDAHLTKPTDPGALKRLLMNLPSRPRVPPET